MLGGSLALCWGLGLGFTGFCNMTFFPPVGDLGSSKIQGYTQKEASFCSQVIS